MKMQMTAADEALEARRDEAVLRQWHPDAEVRRIRRLLLMARGKLPRPRPLVWCSAAPQWMTSSTAWNDSDELTRWDQAR